MAQSSWPTTAGGRAVSDAQYEAMAVGYAADGIIGFTTDTATVYADSTGMQVKIRANKNGSVRGRGWTSGTTEFTKSIASNGAGSTRIDLVVLRLTRSSWETTVEVRQGTAGSGVPSPVRDAPGTGSNYWEVPLATVTVANGAVTISAANVTSLAPIIPPQFSWTTFANRMTTYAGQFWGETDTGQFHWNNGTAIAPLPGQPIRYARLSSGNLYTNSSNEQTIYTCAVPANVLQPNQAYEVHAEATAITGASNPGDLSAFLSIKAGGTTICTSADNHIFNTGGHPRMALTGIYVATNTSAVTFTVTAGRSTGSVAFDVLATASDPFVFFIKALGPSSQMLTS